MDTAKKITEAEFQKLVIDLAKYCGWRVAHFRTVRIQRKDGTVYYATPVEADGEGFPDLLLVKGERMIWAELKVGSNKPTPEQYEWLSVLAGVNPLRVRCYVWKPEGWDRIEKLLTGRAV